jgi:hypothetical protein
MTLVDTVGSVYLLSGYCWTFLSSIFICSCHLVVPPLSRPTPGAQLLVKEQGFIGGVVGVLGAGATGDAGEAGDAGNMASDGMAYSQDGLLIALSYLSKALGIIAESSACAAL